MRNRLIIITLLGPMMAGICALLGMGLGSAGFDGLSRLCYVLALGVVAAMLLLSRCPVCGWPMILDYRHHPRDCVRCGYVPD